jgi:hypothetical protein
MTTIYELNEYLHEAEIELAEAECALTEVRRAEFAGTADEWLTEIAETAATLPLAAAVERVREAREARDAIIREIDTARSAG